jgi:hypothetical protein
VTTSSGVLNPEPLISSHGVLTIKQLNPHFSVRVQFLSDFYQLCLRLPTAKKPDPASTERRPANKSHSAFTPVAASFGAVESVGAVAVEAGVAWKAVPVCHQRNGYPEFTEVPIPQMFPSPGAGPLGPEASLPYS